MLVPKFFIVADRGEAKIYQFRHHGGRPSGFALEEAFVIEESHQHYRDRFSDQAGTFRNNASSETGSSAGERHEITTETNRRIFRRLGEKITGWLDKHQSPAWAFAAPSEINGAILKEVASGHRLHLHQNLEEDLIHLPVNRLIHHLEAASSSDIGAR